MSISPDFETFEKGFAGGKPQLVWTTLVADLETPVSAFLKITDDERGSFLFESVEGGETRGRYSFLGVKPDLVWRARGNQPQINRQPGIDVEAFEDDGDDTLASLRRLVEASRLDLPKGLPPMSAGLFGYMGYDMVRLMEHLPDINEDVLNIPDGVFVRPTLIAVFDAVKDIITLITPVWTPEVTEKGVSAKAAYAQAQERLDSAMAALDGPLLHDGRGDFDVPALADIESNISKDDYFKIVEKAKEYIRAGDIFQVVPSQRFSVPFTLPPIALYRALRRTNPSPYMYYLNYDNFSVVGSSPEILVRLSDGKVTIRPIAGTRPRGDTPEDDLALEKDLLSDPKELSEHLMLLDLGRNDTGRVSRVGTVEVTDSFFVERYSHVMHIVSNVEGEMDFDRFDAVSALYAGFPAGTVSGAPKVRAMEIIDELEPEKRGLYAGGVCYFGADGSMDTAIVLRTGIVKDDRLYVQAGGGVVADSDPEAEYQETVNKAKAVFRAAEEAIRFASTAKRGQ